MTFTIITSNHEGRELKTYDCSGFNEAFDLADRLVERVADVAIIYDEQGLEFGHAARGGLG